MMLVSVTSTNELFQRTGRNAQIDSGSDATELWGEALNEQTTNADSILVKASKEGDSAAFARLVGPCQGRLLALALGVTRNREDAEDVVQKSLLQAFVHLDAFEGGSRFSTWLMRIALNEALMNLRK